MIYSKDLENKIKENLINFKTNQINLAKEFLDLILTEENLKDLENQIIQDSKKGKFKIEIFLPFPECVNLQDLEKFKNLLLNFLSNECYHRFSSENIGWLGELKIVYAHTVETNLRRIINLIKEYEQDILFEKVYNGYSGNKIRKFYITDCYLNFKLFILHKNANCVIENDWIYI